MATFGERVVAYLQDHNQRIEADNATGKLAKALRVPQHQMGGLSSALKRLETDGVIERTVVGKRTKGIYLIPTATNGQEPAPKAPVADDEDEYLKLGLGVLRAASKALAENDSLRKELEHVRSQLQAAELSNAAMERQVSEAKATAERVAAGLSTEVKKDVQALLTKVKRLG